jgi:hypothetical protein
MLIYLTYYNEELLNMSTNNIEQFIDHEVRIRMLERTYAKGLTLLWWILGTAVAAVVVPIILHHYHLA